MSEKGPTTVDMIASEIENLRSLLVEIPTLDGETKKGVDELKNEMKLLVDILRDKKLEEGSCKLNYLMSEVVQMARYVQNFIKEDYNSGCFLDLTTSIKDLKETNKQLHELGESQNRDGAGEGDGDMVGFEKDAKLLIDGINSYREKQEPYVACIRGIAGSGKTTLLRHLYNHTDIVHENFDHRVWVDCTGILSYNEFLINLIRQLPGGDAMGEEEMEIADLLMCVVQRLQGKRFFLVLDDVRIIQSMLEFIPTLHHAGGRHILLFACRRTDFIRKLSLLHDMKPLDVDKSWQLLLNLVLLLSNNKVPKKVERRGKAVLMKHTGGVPLAIKEAAMEWVEKRGLGIEWEEVVESEDLELRATLTELDSSVYRNLDPDTKSCFQHLSFFKQGTTVRAQRFLNTLVASGVLDSPDGYERCLQELKKEGIIVIELNNSYSRCEKNVLISPIFHKLSITKAKKGEYGNVHCVIYCSRERFNCSTDRNKQIICLSFNGGGCFSDSPSYWKSFEQLRVLDFEGFGLKFLPEIVGELIELRYLGLRNNYIQELPHSLGYLKKLEVLDIAQNFMVEVPDIIWEMDALVDLYMSDIFCMKPLKLELLKKLRTLTYISVYNWAGLQMMSGLNKLGIEGLDGNLDLGNLFISLADMENLQCLVLRGFRFKNMPSLERLGVLHNIEILKLDGLITKLPRPEDFPPYLFILTLVNSNLDDDPMPILEKLPNLHYLKLKNAYSGQQMVISEDGFLNLKCMCINELWHLRNIQVGVGGGTLENIWKLKITSCPYLDSLPKEMFRSTAFWKEKVKYLKSTINKW